MRRQDIVKYQCALIANDCSSFCRFLASFRNGSGQFYLTSSSHAHQSLITIQYNWCTAGLLPSTHDDRPGEMMFWLFEPETQAVPNTMGNGLKDGLWAWLFRIITLAKYYHISNCKINSFNTPNGSNYSIWYHLNGLMCHIFIWE